MRYKYIYYSEAETSFYGSDVKRSVRQYIDAVFLSKSACLYPWKGLKCTHSGDRFLRHFLSGFEPLRSCWIKEKQDITLEYTIVILMYLLILSIELFKIVKVTEKMFAPTLRLQSQKDSPHTILGGLPDCNAEIQTTTTTFEAGTVLMTLEEVVM